MKCNVDLVKIKRICDSTECRECPFMVRSKNIKLCLWDVLPRSWDVDKIEEILTKLDSKSKEM